MWTEPLFREPPRHHELNGPPPPRDYGRPASGVGMRHGARWDAPPPARRPAPQSAASFEGAGSQHVAVSDLANGGVRAANGAADGEAAFHQQMEGRRLSPSLSPARQSNRAPPPTSPLATYLRSELLEVAGGEVEARLADQVVSSARNRLLSHYGDEESFFAPKKKSKKKRRTDAHGASEQAGELPSERRERVRSLLCKYLARRMRTSNITGSLDDQ